MFKNTPFEALAKSMTESAPKFDLAAMQDLAKPIQDNLKAWGDLAQKQAQVAQASVAQNVEAFKSIKEPQAALEAMKTTAETSLAIATQNLKDVTALSIAQFKSTVDAIEKAHPTPEAFAGVSKSLKEAVATMEKALDSAIKTGTAAAKKSRSA